MVRSYPLLLVLTLVYLLCMNASADRLRVSPEDRRLRVAVSHELPASLRMELKRLASSTPLPVEGGVVQSERLIAETFSNRRLSDERILLVHYYFLVARLDHSQLFSDEFRRRQRLIKSAIELLDEYIDETNLLLRQGSYQKADPIEITQIQEFPLERAERDQDGGLILLHRYPQLSSRLGHSNLSRLRQTAQSEREMMVERLSLIVVSEREFLQEASYLGEQLIEMRPAIRELVRVPGEGLPFSL